METDENFWAAHQVLKIFEDQPFTRSQGRQAAGEWLAELITAGLVLELPDGRLELYRGGR